MKKQLIKIRLPGRLVNWIWDLIKLPQKFDNYDSSLLSIEKKIDSTKIALQNIDNRVSSIEPPSELNDIYLSEPSEIKNNDSSFEEVFRGSRKEIKSRQEKYIKYIKEAIPGNSGKYFLDIGSGRGEFLELLKENKIKASGLEIDKKSFDALVKEGYDAENQDVNTYLKTIDSDSLNGISMLQVLEHVDPNYVNEFIKLAKSKLSKNGILIIETVNLKCFSAFANFYLDTSHVYPYPAEFLNYILRKEGFTDLKILYLSPCEIALRKNGSPESNYMEYAIICKKI